MAENTSIEWCDHTFNPWIGCTKVSTTCSGGGGCDHCYAEHETPVRVLRARGIETWGAKAARQRTSEANWKKPKAWNAAHAEFFAQHGRRQRVFCASLADVFDNAAPDAWRADLFQLIADTPYLDWLLLTKRIGNAAGMLPYYWAALSNVWLGATVVNQAEVDRDIPKLLAVPARVRFLSIEPMLGPISLDAAFWSYNGPEHIRRGLLHWVIAGGESGPQARPSHPDWYSRLRGQCVEASVPFLFKQWGEWLPINQQDEAFTDRLYRSNRKAALHQDQGALDDIYGRTCTVPYGVVHLDGSFHEPLEPMAFLQGTGAMTTFKVGKKAAGRLLDGVEHNGFPQA